MTVEPSGQWLSLRAPARSGTAVANAEPPPPSPIAAVGGGSFCLGFCRCSLVLALRGSPLRTAPAHSATCSTSKDRQHFLGHQLAADLAKGQWQVR